jgi:membrane protease YdiL (CAAX protease family)
MLGLLIELIVSWLLLWIFCKADLRVLGIVPTKSRMLNLVFGFLIAAACCTAYYLSFSVFTTHRWTFNPDFTSKIFAKSSLWTLVSVLYEELLFRGAILYILIQKVGVKTACIISAVCFGIYHWFTSGALGDPVQMIIIFIMTGIWGLMFAMAFAKTRSLYLPIGIHLGWNLFNIVVFSHGPLGNQLLIGAGEQRLGAFLSILVFVFQILAVPVISYLYMRRRINES